MPWRMNPLEIEHTKNHNKEFQYIMALDETGTPSLNDKNDDWFTLTGTVFPLHNFNETIDKIMDLKRKYWEDALYKEKRVILHSREIRQTTGPFNPRVIEHRKFKKDLAILLSKLPIEIYSCCINKRKLEKNYSKPWDPYEISSEFIAERFCFRLNREGSKGLLLLESRNKVLDIRLHKKFLDLLMNGNRYHDNNFFSKINGIYFNNKTTLDEKKSYLQLEIADICSYSIFNYVRNGSKDIIFEAIENKISFFPNYEGRGLKIFP